MRRTKDRAGSGQKAMAEQYYIRREQIRWKTPISMSYEPSTTWLATSSMVRQLQRADDLCKRALVFTEVVLRRDCDDIKKVTIRQECRVEADTLGLAGHIGSVREVGANSAPIADIGCLVVRRSLQTGISLRQRGNEGVCRALHIASARRCLSGLDTVCKDTLPTGCHVASLRRERDAPRTGQLLPVIR